MAIILFLSIATLFAGFSQPYRSEAPGPPVLTIERTGGFAGVHDQISIFPGGKVLDKTGKVRRVRPARIEGFIRSVEKIGASAPEKPTSAQAHCSDCFTYTIKILQGGTEKKFLLKEPLHISEEESEDSRSVHNFLSLVFSETPHK